MDIAFRHPPHRPLKSQITKPFPLVPLDVIYDIDATQGVHHDYIHKYNLIQTRLNLKQLIEQKIKCGCSNCKML